jgi:hypothetical protein
MPSCFGVRHRTDLIPTVYSHKIKSYYINCSTSFDDRDRKFPAVCDIRMCIPGAERPKTRQVTTIWSRGLVVVVKHIKDILLHSRDARNAARSNKMDLFTHTHPLHVINITL